MGTLWHGTLTARRYAMVCPYCQRDGATVDCDSMGRTMIDCACHAAPFPMPRTNVKAGDVIPAWRVDLSPAEVSTVDPRPPKPVEIWIVDAASPNHPKPVRRRGRRTRTTNRVLRGKPCPTEDCGRVCGPKAKYCNKCTQRLNAQLWPCPEPGCTNLRRHRAPRCRTCQAKKRRESLRSYLAVLVEKPRSAEARRAAKAARVSA